MNERTVPLKHWLYLAGVLGLVWVLASAYAEKSQGADIGFDRAFIIEEVTPVRGDIGYVTEDTNLCHVDSITERNIRLLTQWTALIERLNSTGGTIFLSESDNALGDSLSRWCMTLDEGYPVMIFQIEGEHALIFWDRSLGFDPHPLIIKLSDFQAGGLRL